MNKKPISASVALALASLSALAAELKDRFPGCSVRMDSSRKTVQQQIIDFVNTRAANVARMTAITQATIDEGRGKNDGEATEFDDLDAQVQSIDRELVSLRRMAALQVQNADVVDQRGANGDGQAPAQRQNSGIVFSRSNLEPGVRMARYGMAMFRAAGNPQQAVAEFKADRRWMAETPEIAQVLMAAVNAGDTTTSGWASELVYAQQIESEFIEYLRPQTIIGRIPNFARVPFNIRISGLTAAPTGYWVGQGKAIPLSRPTTTSATLAIAKAAGLCVITEELARLSSPSAEMLVRNELAKSVIQVLDDSFINPNNGGIANEKPASMLYGVTPVTPTGTDYAALRTDIQSLMETPLDSYLDPTQGVWIMSASTALKLSMMVTSLDVRVFPELNLKGGTFLGLPVVVSQLAQISGSPQYNDIIVLLHPQEVLMADDGNVSISISREASIEMDSAPTNQSVATSTGTTVVSMFQTESLAIKATRYINWTKKRSIAAQWIQAALYK